jgi:tetratricopeptide (TPR) repeat protein
MSMKKPFGLLPFAMSVSLACAQMSMSMPEPRPVPLVAGLGNSHHIIRTTSPEAQKYFDQGMDYLFAFNHEEARRSFAKAAEIDPKAAMPEWGVALAVGPNYNDIDIGNARETAAVEAIAKAKQLSAGGPSIETDYIAALSTRYGEDTKHDLHVQGDRYSRAMKALVAKHPDDLDAAVLYAESLMDLHPWQLWSADGKPAPGTEEAVATLQSVILRDPSHVGANHFLIHAVEASPDPSLAIASADRLRTLAPAAGHLVHMPAHIYQRVGDFNDSAEANRKAIAADQAYFAAEHMLPAGNMYYDMYYVHNIHFLASACNMEGNAECAIDAAKKLVDYTTLAYAKDKQVEWFMPTQPWMLVRFNRWDEILKEPAPPKEMFVLTAFWHYARGSAYVALKQPGQAATERAALAAAITDMPKDLPPDFNNPAKTALELALTVLDARITDARIPNTQADRMQTIALWKKAVTTLDTFAYDEPADWYYPIRESLGGALLRNHQPVEAEAVFRRDLEQNPGSGRSLFGLWQSLLMEHRLDDAAFVKTQFDAAWSHATITLNIDDL